MKKKIVLPIVILVLFLTMFETNLAITETFPENEEKTVLYVNPQRINAVVNEVISIEVRIANAINLYAYDFKLYYDKDILNCLEAVMPPGHFLDSPNIFKVKNGEIHQDEGFVWFVVTLLGDEKPRNGSGVLGIITFQVMNEGWSALDLSDSTLIGCNEDYSIQEYKECFANGFFATPAYANFVLHGIAIIDVELSSKNIVVGDPIEIKVLVKNEGTEAETFEIKVFCNDNLIGTQTVKDLPPGSKSTLTFNWETVDIELSNYTIIVQADVVPEETDIADNTYAAGRVRVYSSENSQIARINQLLITTDLNLNEKVPKTEFERGESLGLWVNYTLASAITQICFDIRAYDSEGKEISLSIIHTNCDKLDAIIEPHTSYLGTSITIPEFATLGEAKIVVRILSDWLWLGPEEYARAQINFYIVG